MGNLRKRSPTWNSLPTPRARVPGLELRRLPRFRGEDKREAMARAACETWWPRVVRRVVLAGETGVNADEQRIWCAGRASVHLDVAIAQLADLLPCVREMHEEGLEEQVHQAAVYLWNIRERMFEIVEEYDEEPESDE